MGFWDCRSATLINKTYNLQYMCKMSLVADFIFATTTKPYFVFNFSFKFFGFCLSSFYFLRNSWLSVRDKDNRILWLTMSLYIPNSILHWGEMWWITRRFYDSTCLLEHLNKNLLLINKTVLRWEEKHDRDDRIYTDRHTFSSNRAHDNFLRFVKSRWQY